MTTAMFIINVLSAVFALTAAAYWFKSATTKVKVNEKSSSECKNDSPPESDKPKCSFENAKLLNTNKDHPESSSVDNEIGTDVVETMVKQSKLSACAAGLAALAALCQAAVLVLSLLTD